MGYMKEIKEKTLKFLQLEYDSLNAIEVVGIFPGMNVNDTSNRGELFEITIVYMWDANVGFNNSRGELFLQGEEIVEYWNYIMKED